MTRGGAEPGGEGRLARVEEAIAFGERKTEQLDGELRVLFDRVLALARRIDAVEARLADALAGDDEAEAGEDREADPGA